MDAMDDAETLLGEWFQWWQSWDAIPTHPDLAPLPRDLRTRTATFLAQAEHRRELDGDR